MPLIHDLQKRLVPAVNEGLTARNGTPTTPSTAEVVKSGRHVFTWVAHARGGEPEQRVTVTLDVVEERPGP